MRLLNAIICFLLVSGCTAATVQTGERATATAPSKTPVPTSQVNVTCKTDADCVVKDVGNCCGYFPACVNTASPTFPEQVRAACAKEGTSSICGFAEISTCECVDSQCRAASTEAAVD